MTQHTPPSIEVARTQAIANVYAQLGTMHFTTADDALDAAAAILRLGEAEDNYDWVNTYTHADTDADATPAD